MAKKSDDGGKEIQKVLTTTYLPGKTAQETAMPAPAAYKPDKGGGDKGGGERIEKAQPAPKPYVPQKDDPPPVPPPPPPPSKDNK